MASVNRYEDLVAWQKAYALVLEIYRITRSFPADERFGLTQQMRRAVVSIPSNIAEGFGRHTRSDYLRFLDMALRSTYETQTQLRIAFDLDYTSNVEVVKLVGDVERLLGALIRSLRRLQH